ncbi:hypothetical protein VP01_4733g1 [Puccinia sorghi]|uniref:Uncharacterized protein n=1 Tax=Puccinia sorghi TaxID=27349 RepID=A0A0L6UMX5_9BASI|nr:hypothetical protein VP01_4733g1 [Puccinia sorghi]
MSNSTSATTPFDCHQSIHPNSTNHPIRAIQNFRPSSVKPSWPRFCFPKAEYLRSSTTSSARTTKDGFINVIGHICGKPVFHQGGIQPQIPIAHQLALTLECLGTNGNGASVGRLSFNQSQLMVSTGHQLFGEGFHVCIGFFDGTTIPLSQRPVSSLAGQAHAEIAGFLIARPYDYLLVHALTYLISFLGQYLLDDLAYKLSLHLIPAYKALLQDEDSSPVLSVGSRVKGVEPLAHAPASNIQIKSDFNYCLAKARVQNKHAIGILKSLWASLREI